MNNDYANLNRQPVRTDMSKRKTGNDLNLYLMLGGAALLAAVVGGMVVYFTLAPAQAPQVAAQQAPIRGTAAPQQAAGNTQAQPQQQAEAAAPVSPWTTVATYGSWQVRCQNPNNPATKLCTAVLEVIDNKSKRTLMAWIVGPDNKGVLQTVLQTPTGVLVGSGVDIKFGTGAPRHVNYISCLPQQCTAAAPMDDAFVKESLASQKANIILYASNGKNLDFGIPLTGFDKAMAAIKK